MSELLPEIVWREIEPLLPPPPPPSPKGGRPPVSHRQALTGIVFLLKTGLPWQMIPKELNCGSGSTCWRRFQEWTAAGIWPRVHEKLLGLLGRRRQVDLSRVVVDSASVRAQKGGAIRGRTPPIGPKKAANAM